METYTRCLVLPSTYRESVWLMHLSHTLESLPGVQKVAVMMGTPHNKAVLQEAELLTKYPTKSFLTQQCENTSSTSNRFSWLISYDLMR